MSMIFKQLINTNKNPPADIRPGDLSERKLPKSILAGIMTYIYIPVKGWFIGTVYQRKDGPAFGHQTQSACGLIEGCEMSVLRKKSFPGNGQVVDPAVPATPWFNISI